MNSTLNLNFTFLEIFFLSLLYFIPQLISIYLRVILWAESVTGGEFLEGKNPILLISFPFLYLVPSTEEGVNACIN